MTHSLAQRYLIKLVANIASVPLYFLMEAILPRALGPRAYGNYNFATNLFQQLAGFLDMGTSTCFYNALSKRQNETSLFAFYLRISIIVAFFTAFAGFALLCPQVGQWLMPDVPLWFAPLAALWAFLTWWGRVLRSMNDALGATIPSELWRASISLLGIALLAALFFTDTLNIKTLFVQQYAMLGSIVIVCWLVSLRHWQKNNIKFNFQVKSEKIQAYKKEFFNYSHPLFVQALLSFLMLSAERWLLQWFDGSAQQGFFALSQKVSMACFLFVSAMTPLLMREFSIAWGKRDLAGIGKLLSRFAPLLYALAAYFSCFTLAEGQALVEIFGGTEFAAATLPVQIMALYPLHQAYGQLAGSIFHASGKTKILRNIAACECIYGFAAAWFLLAPANLFGLSLGAAGLAIKTVCVQFLTVNLYLWLASNFIPFSYWKNLAHQISCLIILLVLAFCCRELTLQAHFLSDYNIIRFLLSGLIYTIAVIVSCIISPNLIGLSRQEIYDLAIRFHIVHVENR